MSTNLIGVNEVGEAQSIPRSEIEAPMVILDSISTSKANISSVDARDDKSAELAELLNSKKYVTIDTKIALNNEVKTTLPFQQIIGAPGCNLLIGPDMGNRTALRIAGNNSIVERIQMRNPLEVADRTINTTRQGALAIEAHNVTVARSFFEQMLHSVYVLFTGEWYGSLIDGNFAVECLGAGAGPTDQTSTWGEDKGDAFAVWGAGATVVNNFASAKAGQDCRIAFHAEGMPGSRTNQNPLTDEADFIFANNKAIGSFRRHYVFEGVKRGIMNGNISAGGATWWNVALIQTKDVTVSNMLLHVTRTADDYTGQHWSPDRAAMFFMNYSQRSKFSNVKAFWAPDAAVQGLSAKDDGKDPEKLGHVQSVIENVELYMNPASRKRGMNIMQLKSPTLKNIHIENCAEPIFGFNSPGIAKISGLNVKNFTGAVYCEGNATGGMMIDGANLDNSELATGGAASAIRSVNTGFTSVKNVNITNVDALLHITNGARVTHLTAAQNQSIGSVAKIAVDYQTSGTLPVQPNILNNIDIIGSFTKA